MITHPRFFLAPALLWAALALALPGNARASCAQPLIPPYDPACTAMAAPRSVTFATPGFKDCFISVYNPSTVNLTLNWKISTGNGLGGVNEAGWVNIYAKQQEIPAVGNGGPICAAPCTTGIIKPGATVQLLYSNIANFPGTFSGTLQIDEAYGFAVASGYCGSEDTRIAFPINGGAPF